MFLLGVFWSVFSAFGLNTDQKNSEHGHFLRRINACKHTSNNKHCEGRFNKSSVSSIEHPRLVCYLRALLGSSALSMHKKCLYSELFWFVFSRIRTEYREIRSTPYSVRMLKNADQNNSEYGPFSGSA